MLGRTYDGQNCSAARTLELVGERWSLLIMRDALFRDMTRFTQFQRSLGVAPNVLTARLEGFVAAGLLELRERPERRDQHEYVPTEKGRDLAPIVLALIHWGDRWAAPDGPPVVFEHAHCGGLVDSQQQCAGCGLLVDPAALRAAGALSADYDRR